MKILGQWLPLAASVVACIVLPRGVGGLPLQDDEIGGSGKPLLRAGGGGSDPSEGDGGQMFAVPIVDELKDGVQSLSAHVHSTMVMLEAGVELQPDQAEELGKELHDFQLSLSLDHLAIPQATFKDKVMMIQEVGNSYIILDQLAAVLESAPELQDLTSAIPAARAWITDLRKVLGNAEAATDDFLNLMLSSGDPKEDSGPKNDSMDGDEVNVDERHRHLSVNSSSAVRGIELDSEDSDDTDDADFDRTSEEPHHWHGFSSGQEYRDWRRQHTHSAPQMEHLFNVHEQLGTGNHRALRETLLGKAAQHHEKIHGRRLQSSADKEEQCKLLVACARKMSLYDLIFYHFSDYIDTQTGIFTQGFRLPKNFRIVQLEDKIKRGIVAVESVSDKDTKLSKCDNLLSLFHQQRATKDPYYWAWKAGVVTEVCYASETTKKIDLFLIKKHIGARAAERLFQETLHAAKKLHEIRDMKKHQDEQFVYLEPSGGVRYPVNVVGFRKDPDTLRPLLPVKVEEFYNMKPVGVNKISEVKFTEAEVRCPSGWILQGMNEVGWAAECVREWHGGKDSENIARKECSNNGGRWIGSRFPYTCYFPADKEHQRKFQTDNEIINSTLRVFADTSFGQVKALSMVGRETFKFEDKHCPNNWVFMGLQNGLECKLSDVEKECTNVGGIWLADEGHCADYEDCPPHFSLSNIDQKGKWCTASATHEGIVDGNHGKRVCEEHGGLWPVPQHGQFKCIMEEYTILKQPCKDAGGIWLADKGHCEFGGCPPHFSMGNIDWRGIWCVASATHRGIVDGNHGKRVCEEHGGSWPVPQHGHFKCIMSEYTLLTQPSLPGYCCLDAADDSGTWGEPYHCSERCVHHAPALAGISQGTCDIYGGQWCQYPVDCSALQRCKAKYLKAASSNGNSKNPTFADYLRSAPNITNPLDPAQCGRVREYFGFDKTFPIDLKICNEIKGYQNSGNMKFLDDVAIKMPRDAKPSPELGGGEFEEIKRHDVAAKAIQSYAIGRHKTKKPLKNEKARQGSYCNGSAQVVWRGVRFGLAQTAKTVEIIYKTIVSFACPKEPVSGTICAGSKNILAPIALLVKTLADVVLAIADFTQKEVCNAIDPYSLWRTHEQVVAVYHNTNTMYNFLDHRNQQTHASLDAISAQLPKIAPKGERDDATLSNVMDIVETIQAKCSSGGNGRMLTTDLNPSSTNNARSNTHGMGEDEKKGRKSAGMVMGDLTQLKEEMKAEMQLEMALLKEEMKSEMSGVKENLQRIEKMLQTLLPPKMAEDD